MNRVYFRNTQKKYPVRTGVFRSTVLAALEFLGLENHSLTVVYCGKRKMRGLNETYRHRSGPTDVLSFVDGESEDDGRVYLGEMFIAPAVAQENALEYGAEWEEELHMLHVHGVLHLAGRDHETDRGEMLALQADILTRLGFRSRAGEWS